MTNGSPFADETTSAVAPPEGAPLVRTERAPVRAAGSRPIGRVERWAPLVTGIALAAPTLLAYNLPTSDLPMHEAVVGILRHFGDPAYFPPDLYQLNLGHPNQLFHVSAWLLSYAVGVRWACKLVVALAQIAILEAGARLSDHLGRSRWAALLLAPLSIGFTYYWGLVANLLGFAAFFAALPLLDRAGKEPTPRSIAAACAMLTLLFFAHESAFAVAIGFSGLAAIAHPLELRRTTMRLVPVLFGVVSGVAHFFYSLQFFTKSKVELPPYFPSLKDKLAALPADLFGSHDLETRTLLLGLGTTGIVALLVGRLRSREALPPRPASKFAYAQALLLHYRFEVTAAVFVVAFVVVPFSWNSATLLHARFIGPAWALIALTAAPRGEPPRVAKLTALVVPIGILLLSWPQFVDCDRISRSLDRIMAQIPLNSSVTIAAMDRPRVPTRVYSSSMGPARVAGYRGGRMSSSLTPSPISPVQVRPEYRWNEQDRRLLLGSSLALLPTFDLDRIEWVIAHSRDPIVRRLVPLIFEPDAKVVAEDGEWLLLRSTHPQVPLTSPDVTPPPGLMVLGDRVKHVLGVQEGILRGHLPATALDTVPWRPEQPDGGAPDAGNDERAVPPPAHAR